MEIFLYPVYAKGGGLSSPDQNFRGAIAPVAPVVQPPLILLDYLKLNEEKGYMFPT